MKKPQTEITITELSVQTRADRHKCRQALADIEPVRTRGAVKYFNRSQALEALQTFITEKSGRAPAAATVNGLRILAAIATQNYFEFIGNDDFGLPVLQELAADLGIETEAAEKLTAQLWVTLATRTQRYLAQQWIDKSLDGNLDDMFRRLTGREPLPWAGEEPHFEIPERFKAIIKKHSKTTVAVPRE